MKKVWICVFCLLIGTIACRAQSLSKDGSFALALPAHQGQLTWSAQGFTVVQNSAEPNGGEIGVRATDATGKFTLLGFLFLFPEQAHVRTLKRRIWTMPVRIFSRPSPGRLMC
jgi:hypothetical protein